MFVIMFPNYSNSFKFDFGVNPTISKLRWELVPASKNTQN
jgi:hypothetical protein